MKYFLQNRPGGGPMSDEQRKAMFARMRGGGGGGGRRRAAEDAAASVGDVPLDTSTLLQNLYGNPVQNPSDPYAGFASPSYGQDTSFVTSPGEPSAVDKALANLILGLSGARAVAAIPQLAAWVSSLGPTGQALLKAVQSWKTPIASGATAWGIGEYRDANPTMDPRGEKALAIAQQIAGYVSAITGLGTAKGQIGKALPAGVKSAVSGGLKSAGTWLEDLGKAIGGYMPSGVKGALSKLYGGYTKLADVTGASISDLGNVPKIPGKFQSARNLARAAEETMQQAAEIERIAGTEGEAALRQAYADLHASHEASLAFDPAARDAYRAAAGNFWDTKRGLESSKMAVESLRSFGGRLARQADNVQSDAVTTTIKAALVTAGFAAKEGWEESQIRDAQRKMEEAWAQGEDYVFDPAKPRGPQASAAAFAAGTLGNPIEKQTRYGLDSYATQVANYRAQYDAIGKAEASGEMSPGEAETQRMRLSEDKPMNMAGKGAWTFAPASAAFLSWQAGNVKDYFDHEVEVGRVDKVLDGDTIEVAGKKIRLLGVDTPESVHPNKPVEYLGPEASHFQKENLTGKTVRLVQSPGVDTDKYGRSLRYVETLPGPLGAAFNLPGVGKWIPGTDENKRLIDEGYGQPRYLELSGGHERQIEYDKATARAKAAGKGVHSTEGMQKLDYHYQTYDEKHGRTNAPPDNALATALGLGLMVSGNSGALKEMGPAGNVVAQTWNAALAGFGTAEFNQKARQRQQPVRYRPPRTIKTEYETQAQSVIDARRSRTAR